MKSKREHRDRASLVSSHSSGITEINTIPFKTNGLQTDDPDKFKVISRMESETDSYGSAETEEITAASEQSRKDLMPWCDDEMESGKDLKRKRDDEMESGKDLKRKKLAATTTPPSEKSTKLVRTKNHSFTGFSQSPHIFLQPQEKSIPVSQSQGTPKEDGKAKENTTAAMDNRQLPSPGRKML